MSKESKDEKSGREENEYQVDSGYPSKFRAKL